MARRARTAVVGVAVVLLAVTACTAPVDVDPGPASPSVEQETSAPATDPAFLGFDTAGGGITELSRLASLAGVAPRVVSLFVKLDSTFSAATLAPYAAIGVTPFLTLEPWCVACNAGEADQPDYRLQRIVDGAWDDDIRRIAQGISGAGVPVYLRFAHEMNGYWYPWAVGENGNSPALYVAAWRHVHDLVAGLTGTLVKWVWSPNIPVPDRPSTQITAADYPGDSQVDYVGLTCYSRDGGSAQSTCGTGLGELESLTSEPVLLSETGASGPGQAAWIASLPALLSAHPEIRGLVYFNTTTASTGATGDYRFDDTPTGVAAMKKLAAGLG